MYISKYALLTMKRRQLNKKASEVVRKEVSELAREKKLSEPYQHKLALNSLRNNSSSKEYEEQLVKKLTMIRKQNYK